MIQQLTSIDLTLPAYKVASPKLTERTVMNINEIKDLWAPNISNALEQLSAIDNDFKAIEVVIHNASWCPDCEREVSQLLAIDKKSLSGFASLTLHSYEDKLDYKKGKRLGRLSISCLPTLIFYREGKEVLRIEEDSKNNLVEKIQSISVAN